MVKCKQKMKELLPRYILTLLIIITFYGWSLGQSTYLIQIEYPGSHYKKEYYYYMADSLPISNLLVLNYEPFEPWSLLNCCEEEVYLDSLAEYNGRVYDSLRNKYFSFMDYLVENYDRNFNKIKKAGYRFKLTNQIKCSVFKMDVHYCICNDMKYIERMADGYNLYGDSFSKEEKLELSTFLKVELLRILPEFILKRR